MKVLILFLLIFIHACNGKMPDKLASVLPIALFGNSKMPGGDTVSKSYSPPQTPVAPETNSTVSVPTDFGKTEPEATQLFNENAVNRYKNLQIRFSHPMSSDTVNKSFTLLDESGNIISVNMIWDSPVDLIIDPVKELNGNASYTMSITSNAKTNKNVSLKPFLLKMKTETVFVMSHKIVTPAGGYPSGIELVKTNGLILNKTTNPNVVLESSINAPETIKSLKLCKLGNLSRTNTVLCDAEVSYGITICELGSCTSALSTNLTNSAIPPTVGANNYYYRIEVLSGKVYYKVVNFDYGPLAADKNSFVDGAAKVLLDYQTEPAKVPKSATQALSGLIVNFGKGLFTLDGKTLNTFVTTSTSTTKPATDAKGNPCMNWPTTKLANANPANVIKYYNKLGPFCNLQVSGSIFVSSTYPSVKYAAMADVYITDVSIDETAQPTNEDNISIDLKPNDNYIEIYLYGKKAKGKMSLVASLPATVNTTANTTTSSNQLTSVGSTTGLIKGMIITGNGIPSGTTISSISGTTITMSANATATATGISVKFEGIEFFTYLMGDSFVYYGQGISGVDGDAISFAMNENPPSLTKRLAIAKASMTSNTDGKVLLAVNPDSFLPSQTVTVTGLTFQKCSSTFNPTECNPLTNEWSDAIVTGAVTGTGAVASIIADVVNQKIEEVKPQVVQGVVKDIAQNVAPDIVNNIIGQLKTGINVTLPDYLPPPLNKVTLTVKAKLADDMKSKKAGTVFGLEASAGAALTACIKDSANRCFGDAGYDNQVPPTPIGTDSFILGNAGSTLPSILDRSGDNPGILLALHPDAVNQAFYHLWRGGALNFNINKAFVDSINKFAGESGLLKLTSSLLLAEPITTVFAPGSTSLESAGQKIYPGDAVELRVNPILLPTIGIVPLSGNAGQMETPKISVTLSDMEIAIIGKKTDDKRTVYGDVKDGAEYLISKARITLTTKAELGFGKYQLPGTLPSGYTPSSALLSSVGNTSIRLVISDKVGDLYFIVEPLEGSENNPLGLNPDGIKEVLEPLVKSLVLPLLNNITKDIPLPKMRACGLELKELKTLQIPSNSIIPYTLVNSEITNYDFTGDCKL